jgi:hypothetical protein
MRVPITSGSCTSSTTSATSTATSCPSPASATSSPPCGPRADRPNPAMELAKLKEDAIPALLALLEDRRPTRSVGYWRDFAKSRTVLRYQDAAVAMLGKLLPAPLYQRHTTSSYFSVEEPEVRAKVAVRLRDWFREAEGKGDVEKKWLAYGMVDLHPSGLGLLRSIGLDAGQKGKVLDELRRLYSAADPVYRPLIVEVLADLGDTSRVAETLAGEPAYRKSGASAERFSGEEALRRLARKYGGKTGAKAGGK